VALHFAYASGSDSNQEDPMPAAPLAYFITFSTYGVWLHGRDPGSVDKKHNEVGTPFLPANASRENTEHANMREAPYLLDANRRAVVLKTIREVARYRRWTLHACHVRTTHVHVIVTAQDKPEKIMSDFKAYASRRLKEHLNERADCKRWTQHGSTLYLWNEEQVAAKIDYVLNGQGKAMNFYDGGNIPSEPEA
jgi:REP element-mobilizing transposase RayT